MKYLFLASLLITASCASNRGENDIPPYSNETVCSDESLHYKKTAATKVNPQVYSVDELQPRMQSLEPTVRKCYEEEMDRTKSALAFNLCFVVGYSQKGAMEFFEFSTREVELSKDFYSCLATLKSKKELKGLRNVTITQPFRLFPKK